MDTSKVPFLKLVLLLILPRLFSYQLYCIVSHHSFGSFFLYVSLEGRIEEGKEGRKDSQPSKGNMALVFCLLALGLLRFWPALLLIMMYGWKGRMDMRKKPEKKGGRRKAGGEA